jgi:hypothetical protein
MLEPAVASKERHERFVDRVVVSGEIWGLKNKDGWACSASTADGTEGKDVIPFWSDRAYAAQCAKQDWSDHDATLIPLDLFLKNWLPGMAADASLAGTNWNAELCGYEIEPLELKQQLESRRGANPI